MKPGSPIPQPDYAEYERRKAAWIADYPDAPSVLYEIAMRRIAEACGI